MTEDELLDRLLGDGIYNVTDINYVTFNDEDLSKALADEEVSSFIEKYKDTLVVGHPYNVDFIFFLEREPEKLEDFEIEGINCGASMILKSLPEKILILAEDD